MQVGDWVVLSEAGERAFPEVAGREGRVVSMWGDHAWVEWLRHSTCDQYRIGQLSVRDDLTPKLAEKFSHVEITPD